jgi:serine/threonine protein kinase/Flp pilus assembly protein TadD
MTEPSLPEESVFAQAVEIPSAPERAAFLDRACANNPGLRAEVEALLRAHERSGDLLDLPEHVPSNADAPSHESAGTIIGPFKLLEQIGEGGMGTVWMAEQSTPIQRRVAIKVVKEGMDSKLVLARFEAERQALALMEHPNIAKVFEAGRTPSGRPYFVMELVKGQPITKYCDEKRLKVRERLELFGDVCRAVQHAHQKGIIHRDLKPSNVLVAPYDGKPVVKIIDFGVAKATGQRLTDKTLFTGFGALVGTPEYMSPEQAEVNNQDIDTRSDIYSLGVLLYELLTGSTPLTRKRIKEAALLEVLRVIREEEPPRPSTRLAESNDTLPSISAQRQTEPAKLTKLVRGELDWIVMKALEKDRNRRYETANGLAMDVQRYLADEPVAAGPPSAWYRLRKFVRRNKNSLAVAGLILFFIALLGGGGGWVVRDWAARRSHAINKLYLTLDRSELLQGEGKREDALAALQQAELLVGEAEMSLGLSERFAALKEKLDADARDQEFGARFQEIRLRVQSQVQEDKHSGSAEAAFPEIREALRRYGIDIGVTPVEQAAALVQGRPDPARQQIISALDEYLSQAPAELSRDDPAPQWLLAVFSVVDTDAWRLRARKALFDRDWATAELMARTANVRKQPANFLLIVARSLPTSMQASRLELLRKIQRSYPDDLWANLFLADELLPSNERPAEAIRYYTAALALLPENALIYNNRGMALARAGELDDAIADLRHAQVLVPHDGQVRYNLAETLARNREFREAITEYRAYFLQEKGNAGAHYNFGGALRANGDVDEAIAEYREAIRLKNDFAKAYFNLGQALGAKGQVVLAIRELSKAVEFDPEDFLNHYGLGNALRHNGQMDEAIVEYCETICLKEDFPDAHFNLAIALQAKGEVDGAIAAYRQTILLKKDYAEAHCNLGHLLRDKGQFREGLEELRRGHELGSKSPGWSYPSAKWVRECERLVELDVKLPGVISGQTKPASPAEQVEFAALCSLKSLNGTAVRLYREAFGEKQQLAGDLDSQHRYNAACAAALAGCGQGKDTDDLNDKARADLRLQALDWLRADLDAWNQRLNKEPEKAGPVIVKQLRDWLGDTDLTGIRERQSLAQLPDTERQMWHKLWDDVAGTLARAQSKTTPEKNSGAK